MSGLSRSALFRAADPDVFGSALLLTDRVSDLRVHDGQVLTTVTVQGLHHRVCFSDKEEFSWICDCPEALEGRCCVHVVTAGLTYISARESGFRGPRPVRVPTGPVEAAARSASAIGDVRALTALFDEALDVFGLPPQERDQEYLRAVRAATAAVRQLYADGRSEGAENCTTTSVPGSKRPRTSSRIPTARSAPPCPSSYSPTTRSRQSWNERSGRAPRPALSNRLCSNRPCRTGPAKVFEGLTRVSHRSVLRVGSSCTRERSAVTGVRPGSGGSRPRAHMDHPRNTRRLCA